jgi:TonB family protein
LVKVYVDESGRVRKAEVVDADDKALGSAAMDAAERTAYMPVEIDGHRAPFETSIWMSHWSTIDPIRVGTTTVTSQGTD